MSSRRTQPTVHPYSDPKRELKMSYFLQHSSSAESAVASARPLRSRRACGDDVDIMNYVPHTTTTGARGRAYSAHSFARDARETRETREPRAVTAEAARATPTSTGTRSIWLSSLVALVQNDPDAGLSSSTSTSTSHESRGRAADTVQRYRAALIDITRITIAVACAKDKSVHHHCSSYNPLLTSLPIPIQIVGSTARAV